MVLQTPKMKEEKTWMILKILLKETLKKNQGKMMWFKLPKLILLKSKKFSKMIKVKWKNICNSLLMLPISWKPLKPNIYHFWTLISVLKNKLNNWELWKNRSKELMPEFYIHWIRPRKKLQSSKKEKPFSFYSEWNITPLLNSKKNTKWKPSIPSGILSVTKKPTKMEIGNMMDWNSVKLNLSPNLKLEINSPVINSEPFFS